MTLHAQITNVHKPTGALISCDWCVIRCSLLGIFELYMVIRDKLLNQSDMIVQVVAWWV